MCLVPNPQAFALKDPEEEERGRCNCSEIHVWFFPKRSGLQATGGGISMVWEHKSIPSLPPPAGWPGLCVYENWASEARRRGVRLYFCDHSLCTGRGKRNRLRPPETGRGHQEVTREGT